MVDMGTNYYAEMEEGRRVHLTKTSAGWIPSIQWHNGYAGCSCRCEQHHYRGWNEFIDFLKSDETTIVDEYGRDVEPVELIDKMQRFKEENYRQHNANDWPEFVEIDDWVFMGGDWI